MASIDAAASCSWHLLWQCHCNRVMPPLSLHCSAKKMCAMMASAACLQGVKTINQCDDGIDQCHSKSIMALVLAMPLQ